MEQTMPERETVDKIEERNLALLQWAAQRAQVVALRAIVDFAEDPLLIVHGPGAEHGAGPAKKLAALSVARQTAALVLRDALVTWAEGLAREMQAELVERFQTTQAEFAQAEKDYEALTLDMRRVGGAP